MLKSRSILTTKLIEHLEKDPGQILKKPAKQLGVSRAPLPSYLKTLEGQGCVRSKKIGPTKIYFENLKKVS